MRFALRHYYGYTIIIIFKFWVEYRILRFMTFRKKNRVLNGWLNSYIIYYIGSAEGHEYPDLQVGDEVNPRPGFIFS